MLWSVAVAKSRTRIALSPPSRALDSPSAQERSLSVYLSTLTVAAVSVSALPSSTSAKALPFVRDEIALKSGCD